MLSMVAQGAATAATQARRQGAGRSGGGGELSPVYGLAFRYVVQFPGIEASDWISCSGLKVQFGPVSANNGHGGLGTTYLAGDVTYDKITLKRGIDRKHSADLQKWLKEKAWKWVNGEQVDGDSIMIALCGPDNELVARWHLANARPSAWTGPNLEAGTNAIAYETLELVHDGFTMTLGAEQEAAPAEADRAEFKVEPGPGAGGGPITFSFPPRTVTVTYNDRDATVFNPSADGTAGTSQETVKGGITSYGVKDMYLMGPDTLKHVRQLQSWTVVKPGGDGVGPDQRARPKLKVNWGTVFDPQKAYALTTLSVELTRFDRATQSPTRAKIGMTFSDWTVEPPKKERDGAANPHSGGIPGRKQHTVVLGDDLATLARRTYGDATLWRDIARVNAIEDPRRLRPGQVLYLPARSELADLGRRHG